MTFTPIQNRDRARQLVSFEGMELGDRMWPTDIDAIFEFNDGSWLIFEVKHGDKSVPYGQRLVLERFVRDVHKAGKKAIAAVVEHYVSDPMEDIQLSKCAVREVYVGSEQRWREPKSRITAGELARSFYAWSTMV